MLQELEELLRRYSLTPVVEDELFIKMIGNDDRALLIKDLRLFEQRFGIVAELCCPPHEDDSIVLLGSPARIRDAVDEFRTILDFHGVLVSGRNRGPQCHSVCAAEDTMHEAEDLEVDVTE